MLSIGLIFWLIMLAWALLWLAERLGSPQSWSPYANGVMLFLLLFLLGWGTFGPPIHG